MNIEHVPHRDFQWRVHWSGSISITQAMVRWLRRSSIDEYAIYAYSVSFMQQDDAMLFHLTFA